MDSEFAVLRCFSASDMYTRGYQKDFHESSVGQRRGRSLLAYAGKLKSIALSTLKLQYFSEMSSNVKYKDSFSNMASVYLQCNCIF